MIRNSFCSISLALGLVAASASATFAQIERSVEAHGGLAKWRNFGSVEYDATFESAKGAKRDHQLFNMRTRDGLITADTYAIGASKGEVWIKPGSSLGWNAAALLRLDGFLFLWNAFRFCRSRDVA
jgi:hypothetical protein